MAAVVILVDYACCEILVFGDKTTSSGGCIGCDGTGGVIGLLKVYNAELSESDGVEA